ncbi:MAG: hypothetical protein NT164_01130 [Verrucomicrobiae bacterium]|nr:hypothetical protein [Verrucomicrobiae bacterium]
MTAQPCDPHLEDRVATAATLVVHLRIAHDGTKNALDSVNWHTSNFFTLRHSYDRRSSLNYYKNILYGPPAAGKASFSALAAAEKLHSMTANVEEHLPQLAEANLTSSAPEIAEQSDAAFSENPRWWEGQPTQWNEAIPLTMQEEEVADSTTQYSILDNDEALKEAVAARIAGQELNEDLPSLADMNTVLQQASDASRKNHQYWNEYFLINTPCAPVKYYADLTDSVATTFANQIRTPQQAQDSDPIKAVGVMMKKSILVAATRIATPAIGKFLVTEKPYELQLYLKSMKKELTKPFDGSLNTGMASDLTKVERAIIAIIPPSFDADVEEILNHPDLDLPEIKYPDSSKTDHLLTWRKSISTPEVRRQMSETARKALPALVRIENHIAQASLHFTANSSQKDWNSLRRAIDQKMDAVIAAADRESMTPQQQEIFDVAVKAATNAGKASNTAYSTYQTFGISLQFHITSSQFKGFSTDRNGLVHPTIEDCFTGVQAAARDAYAAAEEAMNLYDRYSAAGAVPPSVMATVEDAEHRSAAAATRAYESFRILRPAMDAARAAQEAASQGLNVRDLRGFVFDER